MPNYPVAPEEKERRRRALEDVFDHMARFRIPDTFLAQELGVSKRSVNHYKHGMNRPPVGFGSRARTVLGLPQRPQDEMIERIPNQRPRSKRASKATTGPDPPG